MKRMTTVLLPIDLHARAKRCAKKRGITFGELIRQAVAEKLAIEDVEAGADPLFRPHPVPGKIAAKVPEDFVRNLDDYLYGGKPV